MLQEVSLDLHTSLVEKKPSLSLLSMENLISGSEKGNRGQQMRQELLNEAFSVKAT